MKMLLDEQNITVIHFMLCDDSCPFASQLCWTVYIVKYI